MKGKLLASLSVLGLPFFALAEGQSTPMSEINTKIATQLGTWSDTITNFFKDNIDVIMGIVGIALAVGLLWVVFRLFKKATTKAS